MREAECVCAVLTLATASAIPLVVPPVSSMTQLLALLLHCMHCIWVSSPEPLLRAECNLQIWLALTMRQ